MIRNVRNSSHPFRFVLGYFLKNTGLCVYFTIHMKNYSLKFYPSVMSWLLWTDHNIYDSDLDFFEKYLESGDNVVDVGANIGLITILSSTL